MATGKQGVCPSCGVQDNICIVGDTPIIRVELQSYESDGSGGTKAIIHNDVHHYNSFAPDHRFYCENCDTFFDKPNFV